MGMFDDIKCDMSLPGPCPVDDFQTKDLDCTMTHYAIRRDGRLVDANIRMEKKAGAPPDPGKAFMDRDHIEWHRKWWERKEGPDIPMEYTGSVNFYSNDKDDVWWEFCAFVRAGVVTEIIQISPNPTPLAQKG
jgi:hypothetical protein|tara:strand:- start:1333 stop:1731 length:399 start_codon:yes stop_codon:yes gene_type:complete